MEQPFLSNGQNISKIQLDLIITTFPSKPFLFVSALKESLTHKKGKNIFLNKMYWFPWKQGDSKRS